MNEIKQPFWHIAIVDRKTENLSFDCKSELFPRVSPPDEPECWILFTTQKRAKEFIAEYWAGWEVKVQRIAHVPELINHFDLAAGYGREHFVIDPKTNAQRIVSRWDLERESKKHHH